jgi:hypothetical protein
MASKMFNRTPGPELNGARLGDSIVAQSEVSLDCQFKALTEFLVAYDAAI